MVITIRAVDDHDRPWVAEFLRTHFGSTRVVTRGRLHEADRLPGLVAEEDGTPGGLLTYHVVDREFEVVTLHAAPPGRGVGTRLLDEARTKARVLGCRRLWLITTNDNEPAIKFYQERGMTLVAVHRDAIRESRRLKPEIPLTGVGGRLIEDEIEFEYLV